MDRASCGLGEVEALFRVEESTQQPGKLIKGGIDVARTRDERLLHAMESGTWLRHGFLLE